MKPTPPGWPRLSTALYCEHPREAIDWYRRAFGFEVVIVVDAPDGGVAHSELRYGEAIVMVSGPSGERDARFGVAGRSLHLAAPARRRLRTALDNADAVSLVRVAREGMAAVGEYRFDAVDARREDAETA